MLTQTHSQYVVGCFAFSPSSVLSGWSPLRTALETRLDPAAKPLTLSADGAEEDRLQTGVPAGPGVQWLRDELGLISTTAESEALTGLATGFWKSVEELESFWRIERVFEPVMPEDRGEYLFGEWRRAVARCRSGSC